MIIAKYILTSTYHCALHSCHSSALLNYLSLPGACCPSGVKLYRMANNTLRVYWRSTGGLHNYTAKMVGSQSNYTCTPPPGGNTCEVPEIMCGDVYNVVVAPLTQDGAMVQFCPQRMYSGRLLNTTIPLERSTYII